MNSKVIAGTVLIGITLASTAAKADTGLFGQPVQLDGSLDMRRSTTEQFNPVRGQSVSDRPRPDFDATPIMLGAYQLFPAMNFTSYYDSNIFAQTANETSDYVWKANPAVSLLSNWGRNAISVTGFGDFDVYTDHDEQSYKSGGVQAEGRWDIAHQTWLAGAGSYQRVVELRGSPSTPGSSEGPSEYDLFTAEADAYRGLGILKAKLGYGFSYYDYDPLNLIGGGTLSQNSRDRFQNKVSAEATYDLTENFKPFIRGGYNWRDYTADNQHSSNGQNIAVGTRMDLGGIITAEAYAGYLRQDYFNFGNVVDAIDFGGNLLWNVTGLTSIELKVSRSVEETEAGNASSYVATGGEVTVTHELRRNILVDAHVGYTDLDFQNIIRHDKYYLAGVGSRYFINRNLYADFTYDYQRRGSNTTGENFNRHILLTRLGVQY